VSTSFFSVKWADAMIKLIKSTFFNEKQTKREICGFVKKAKQLSFGLECEQFEKSFAKWQGRKHSVLVNSGSSADLAMIQALLNLGMIKKGDVIGFSSVTWSTNVMSLIQLGLIPIPIDVELDTLNISSRTLEEAMEKHNIKMLFLTNLLGFCDDIDRIKTICSKKNILLIEDNCESLGTVYKGKKLGNFGLMSSFSFYVGHHLSTIEGGAICTDNEKIATMLRLVRAHGWDRNLSYTKQEEMRKKFKVNSTFYSRYTFYDLGYNLRPTEITGFIGNKQLRYTDSIVRQRQKNFLRFTHAIYSQEKRFYPVSFDHIETISNFAVPIICRSRALRDELVERCAGKVEIRPIVGGDMVSQPFFKKYNKGRLISCPNAKIIHTQGLYFGNNPDMTEKEIQTIIKIFTQ